MVGKLSDFYNALAQGGASMMAASGPSRMPVSFGQAFAAGLEGTNNALTAARQRRMAEEQLGWKRQEAERAAQAAERMGIYRNTLPGSSPLRYADDETLNKYMLESSKTGGIEYKSRKFALPDGRIQDQTSMDGGKTWENTGQPYLRREKQAAEILTAEQAKKILGDNYDPRQTYQQTREGIKPVGGRKSSYDVIKGLQDKLESHPTVKTYETAYTQFEAIKEAKDRPGRASDVNIIYALAKLYDPNSVVREGEYNITVKNTDSLPSALLAQIQAVTTGKSALSPTAREAIYKEAQSRIGIYRREAERAVNRYRNRARRAGVDSSRIMYDWPVSVSGPAAPYLPKR